MIEDSLAGKREPEAKTVSLAGTDEGLEEAAPDLRCDTRSCIIDFDEYRTLAHHGANPDIAAVGHGFERVYHEIREYAFHPATFEQEFQIIGYLD